MAIADSGIEVGGISVVSGGGAAGGATGTVADVLAFTGTGPGTLPLAIIGFCSLVAGVFATLFSRRHKNEAPECSGPLADLSGLATSRSAGYCRFETAT